jgi:hypothetical protein
VHSDPGPEVDDDLITAVIEPPDSVDDPVQPQRGTVGHPLHHLGLRHRLSLIGIVATITVAVIVAPAPVNPAGPTGSTAPCSSAASPLSPASPLRTPPASPPPPVLQPSPPAFKPSDLIIGTPAAATGYAPDIDAMATS